MSLPLNSGDAVGNVAVLAAGGVFNVAKIPNLPTSKITSGAFSDARIPNLNASKITAGSFATARIPNLAASKITSGVLGTARLATGTANSTTYLRGDQTWAIIAAGSTFDIHDDVTQSASIADSDRLVFSDEGSAGDPMRYTTAANLANYMQAEVELNADRTTSGRFDKGPYSLDREPIRLRRPDAGLGHYLPDHQLTLCA